MKASLIFVICVGDMGTKKENCELKATVAAEKVGKIPDVVPSKGDDVAME